MPLVAQLAGLAGDFSRYRRNSSVADSVPDMVVATLRYIGYPLGKLGGRSGDFPRHLAGGRAVGENLVAGERPLGLGTG